VLETQFEQKCGPVVSLGGRRCLPNETGSLVDAQVVALELNSEVNLVGQPRKVVRRRPCPGQKPSELPRSSNQSTRQDHGEDKEGRSIWL
jgi:hypothetical protein